MTDPMELVDRPDPTSALSRDPLPPSILADALLQVQSETSVEVGERRIHAENLVAMAATCIRELVDGREGLNEDLYQAVLVAYRRGATEWTRLNYPQWFNAIVAGREVSPPATDRGGV